MNTSTILDMLRDDPNLLDDRKAFLDRMNAQFNVVVKVHEQIVDEIISTSIAEQNGGPATDADVDYALKILEQRPLLEKADAISEKLKAAIVAGEVIDSSGLIQASTDAANAVVGTP